MFEAQTKPMTLDEFIAYALLPENAERNLEFINGEIIEKMPGTTENSGIAANLVFESRLYCQVNNLPCFVSTGNGAYRIGENTLAPDFAYKPTPLTKEYPDPEPPLWVAEVISPNDENGISDALERLIDAWRKNQTEFIKVGTHVEQYSRKETAKTLGSILNQF